MHFDPVDLLNMLYGIWIGGTMVLLIVLVPYELFFAKKKIRMSYRTARVIASGSILWPLVALALLIELIGGRVSDQ